MPFVFRDKKLDRRSLGDMLEDIIPDTDNIGIRTGDLGGKATAETGKTESQKDSRRAKERRNYGLIKYHNGWVSPQLKRYEIGHLNDMMTGIDEPNQHFDIPFHRGRAPSEKQHKHKFCIMQAPAAFRDWSIGLVSGATAVLYHETSVDPIKPFRLDLMPGEEWKLEKDPWGIARVVERRESGPHVTADWAFVVLEGPIQFVPFKITGSELVEQEDHNGDQIPWKYKYSATEVERDIVNGKPEWVDGRHEWEISLTSDEEALWNDWEVLEPSNQENAGQSLGHFERQPTPNNSIVWVQRKVLGNNYTYTFERQNPLIAVCEEENGEE